MIGMRRCACLLLLCWLNAAASRAQTLASPQVETTVPSDGNGLMTLHVYSNLIQMPVLVLSPGLLPLAPIKPERFSLRIDDGPWYRPAHVRPEGADPISLTIVLDFVGEASDLMPKISQTIDRIMPQGLTPRDHVSLFVMQCKLLDMMRDVPAEPGLLQPRIAQAEADWTEHIHKKHAPCDETFHLWDTLTLATLRLGALPGRRVIIAVTDGADRGSKNTPESLAVAMQARAVTTFAVRPEEQGAWSNLGRGRSGMAFQSSSQVTTNDPLDRLSQLSGGVSLPANRWNAGKQLMHIPELVRGRYILEFPRPWNTTAGNHLIDVQVAKSEDFIRVAGTSVPMPDPKIAADPTTLPNDPTLTPQMGKQPGKTKPPPPF